MWRASFSNLQWVVDAYALTLASFLLVAGSLGDRLGRRAVFAIGLGIFSIASLFCGLATDATFLNIFPGLQGVGGAAMFATALALIAQEFEGRERAKAIGIWGATVGGNERRSRRRRSPGTPSRSRWRSVERRVPSPRGGRLRTRTASELTFLAAEGEPRRPVHGCHALRVVSMSLEGDPLQRGRDAYAKRSWYEAFSGLTAADDEAGLDREDLELLATAAYMLGLQDGYFAALERAHQAHLDAGEALRAARCAIWVGLNRAQQGEMARAGGWVARAQRLVEREGRDCAERGYLLMARMFQQEAEGDLDGAVATAAEASKLAERFGDADLLALAGHSQGHMLVIEGRASEGLGLLDEAMVAVTTGELSPIVSGIVYCGVILGCQKAHQTGRAREWTAALTEWCRQQPDMVAFTGRCLVHRAELMQLEGAWAKAIEEAGRAARRCEEGGNARAAGEAVYLRGEIRRLQGDFVGAERDYRAANGYGREPQPGLALLRLAQGNASAALAAIRRARAEASDEPALASILPACCEIMLAAGKLEAADDACGELIEIAGHYEGGSLDAVAARSRGAVALAEGEPTAALGPLREAEQAWRELAAPYEEARTRELVARACGALGDDDAAAMELEQAVDVLRRLGARPDLERIKGMTGVAGSSDSHGLTSRELEVLCLVAEGRTNKAIAAELVLSGRTVDRHVSNIFAKLGVSSRAAATAFAYEHRLL